MLEKNDPYQLQQVDWWAHLAVKSFSHHAVQISQHWEEGAVLEGRRGKQGLCLCLLLPHPVCRVRGRAGLLPSCTPGREVFAVLTLEHISGALQGALFTLCGDGFFLVPGCVTRNSLPSLCCHHGAEFVLLVWLESLWCVPLFHPLPVSLFHW